MNQQLLQLIITAKDNASAVMKKVGNSIELTNKQAKDLQKQGLANMNDSFGGIVDGAKTAALGIAGLGLGFAGMVGKTTADAQTLYIALKSSLGGSEDVAKKAQATITEFAAKTPYSTQQVTEAFIKLKNLGLDPSEKALTAYGNTASSMGKPLNQMIEAVADAATGQFERIKEFGIKTKKEGDNVEFTFNNITTKVKNNSEDIEKYLMNIGNTRFAGAMDEQSKSINGTMSTLQDSISQKMVTIGQALKLDSTLPALFTSLAESIANFDVQPIVDTLNGLFTVIGNIGNWIITNGALVQGILVTLAGAFTGWAVALAYFNITAAGAALGAAGLVPSLLALVPSLLAVGVAGWTMIAPFLPFILIGAAIAGMLYLLKLAFDNNFMGIRDVVNNVFGWLQTSVFQPLGEWFTTKLPVYLEALRIAFEAGWNNIKTNFENVWNGISTFFTAIWESIKVIVAGAFLIIYGIFTGDGELIAQAWEAMGNKLKEIWTPIAEWLTNKFNEFMTWLGNLWTGMIKGITDNWVKAKQAVIDGWNAVETFLKSINLNEMGKNIIQGLIDGIKNMASSLTGALGDVVNGAVNSAKNALGIKSPSRVFMEIGDFTMQGLEKGILNNATLPQQAIVDTTNGMIANGKTYENMSPATGANAGTAPVSNSNTIQLFVDTLNVPDETFVDKIADTLMVRIQQTA